MTDFKNKAARFLASGFYISYIPAALTGFKKFTGSGLFGTALGLLLVPLLPEGNLAFLLFLMLFFFFAVWTAGVAEASYGVHDDPRIVLDEVVGFWTAIAFLPPRIPVWLAGFVLFRIFDAVKPPPCGLLERLPGGAGVVADDVGAGVMANIVLRLLLAYTPWLGQC